MSKKDFLKEQEEFEGKFFRNEEKEFYTQIFEELEGSMEIIVPMDFSIKVSKAAFRKRKIWSDIKLYGFYSILFLVLLFVAGLFINVDNSSQGIQSLHVFKRWIGYGVVATGVYFLVQSLDSILIKSRP